MTTFTLQYDDNELDIIDKINKAIEPHGLKFEDDGEVHDGFIVFHVKTIERPVTNEQAEAHNLAALIADYIEAAGRTSHGSSVHFSIDNAVNNYKQLL